MKTCIRNLTCLAIMSLGSSATFAQTEGDVPPVTLERAAPVVIDKALINDVDLVGKQPAETGKVTLTPQQAALHEKFKKLMTGAKLTGLFTVDGKPMKDQAEETYEISKVEKLPEGDMWVITARIKYGKNDATFPVPIEVKWAGSTPVLTLDNMTIPGLGTFGARVVLHQDKYAGTWQHDDVGGHLFGKIDLGDGEPE